MTCKCGNPDIIASGPGNRCRDCYRQYQREWYHQNKDKHRNRASRYRTRYRTAVEGIILAHLDEHPCVDCGETDPVVLQFDHVRGDKVDSIAMLVGRQAAPTRIINEIAKCEVRCANCHARRTAVQGGWWKTRQ